MAHLVGQNGFHFLLIHHAQKPGGDSHQRTVLGGARRKSVGFTFVDADFRHLQTKLVGLRANHTDEPLFQTGRRIIRIDQLHSHGHLGHGLAHEKRNDRTGKAHHQGEHKKCAYIKTLSGHLTEIDAREHAHDGKNDAEHHHHGDVRENQKRNSLHMLSS